MLQDGEIQRVGGEQPIRIVTRVISATNRRLDELVADGRFREDLFYRLSVVPIRVPALRERLQDIAELVPYFLSEFCARNNFRPRTIEPAAVALLGRYNWPGNVRELRNVVERMAILTPGEWITSDAIPVEVRSSQAGRAGTGLQEVRDSAERERIRQALDQADWNVTAAARLLDTERTALHKRIRALGLRRQHGGWRNRADSVRSKSTSQHGRRSQLDGRAEATRPDKVVGADAIQWKALIPGAEIAVRLRGRGY